MSIDLAILVSSLLATVSLGAIILLRNPTSKTNRRFAFFVTSLSLWTLSNYLADNSNFTLLFTRTTFICGLLIALSAVSLSLVFPNDKLLKGRTINKVNIVFLSVTFLVSLTPFMVADAVSVPNSGAYITVGPLYPVFLSYMVFSFFMCIYNFVLQFRAATTTHRAQIRIVLAGMAIYALFAMISNLLIPLIADDWTSSRFGPVFALIAIATMSYAIVQHGLLDIRLIIARLLAYLASVGVLGALYIAIILLVADLLFNLEITIRTQLIFAGITLVAALTFSKIKRFFTHLTNKFFYQDAYSAEAFFNSFNRAVVSTIDLDELMENTSRAVISYLKSEYVAVAVKDGSDRGYRVVGTRQRDYSAEDIAEVRTLTPRVHNMVIMADELADDDRLKQLMVKNRIALLVRLTEDVMHTKEGIGYLLMGAKRSGSPYGGQDVEVLEAAAKELLLAIQNATRFEELSELKSHLEEEVQEQTADLRHANARLRKLDHTKDDFISMASHQLRTPLTAVKGYVSMVLDGDAGKLTEQQKKMLTQAFLSSQRMANLISDLLNVSRLKTGKFVIELTETDLNTVIDEEMLQLEETAKARELTLTYHKPKEFPILMLDETKMRQVVMNFVDNAVYYTKQGGHIDVYLEDKGDSVEFRVVDDGIGVPRHEQHHLFTKFYRARNAQTARPDGTGLGLFMARKVVVSQGGAIVFNSTEGKGSTFGFSFPKEKLLPQAAPAAPKVETVKS